MRNLGYLFILFILSFGCARITYATSASNCMEKSRAPAEEAACSANSYMIEARIKKLIQETLTSLESDNQRNDFMKSQTAWEHIRKNNCDLLNRRSKGSMHTSDMIYCMTAEAEQRIRILEEINNSGQ